MTITAFESELEDLFQEVPDLQQALVSYMEARSRLREKTRSRGFWPVSANSKGRSGKGKFQSKGFGKGKKGKDRDALLLRISRSNCRICGQRGHWKCECPRNNSAASTSEAPASVAQTGCDPQDEILEHFPTYATVFLLAHEDPGPATDLSHAEECCFATVVKIPDAQKPLMGFSSQVRKGIAVGLSRLVSKCSRTQSDPKHVPKLPNVPSRALQGRPALAPSETSGVITAISEQGLQEVCSAMSAETVEATTALEHSCPGSGIP